VLPIFDRTDGRIASQAANHSAKRAGGEGEEGTGELVSSVV